MVTVQEYKKAIEIVDKFHNQIYNESNKFDNEKITIKNFLLNGRACSNRLARALLELSHEVEYLEDLTKKKCLTKRGFGTGMWREFVILKENNFKLFKKIKL